MTVTASTYSATPVTLSAAYTSDRLMTTSTSHSPWRSTAIAVTAVTVAAVALWWRRVAARPRAARLALEAA